MARRCYRCFKSQDGCLCSKVVPFETETKIVILIHPMEARKERTGTGRVTSLALKNSELIEGVDFTHNKRVNELINDPQYLPLILYPGEESLKAQRFTPPKGKLPLIFVIDGTWPCAKKMMKKSLNLHILSRISFEVGWKSKFRIKQQPHPDCLSTIESVHVLLNYLEKQKTSHLLELLDMMVEYQIKRASNPGINSYRSDNFSDGEKMNYKDENRRGIFHR